MLNLQHLFLKYQKKHLKLVVEGAREHLGGEEGGSGGGEGGGKC